MKAMELNLGSTLCLFTLVLLSIFAQGQELPGSFCTPPSEQNSTNEWFSLTNNAFWDYDPEENNFNDGWNDAYDSALVLLINGTTAPTPLNGSCSGAGFSVDEYVIQVGTAAVTVYRQFYAPSGTDYLRVLDRFTSNETVGIEVEYFSNLGSDGDTEIVATSSGNTNEATIDDRWVVSWDGDGPISRDDPILSFIFAGANGKVGVESIHYVNEDDDVELFFELSLSADEPVHVLQFAGQHTSISRAISVANSFDSVLPPSAAMEMTMMERDSVQNWRPCALGRGWYTVDEDEVTVEVPGDSSLNFELFDSDSNSLGVGTSFTNLDNGDYIMRCTDGSGSLDSTFTVACPGSMMSSAATSLQPWIIAFFE